MRRAARLPVALVLLALLAAAPLAAGHVAFERPSLQPGEVRREVNLTLEGGAARVRLYHGNDPLRETILHDVVPAQGAFRVEHREHLSRDEDAAWVRFELHRLLEYRDVNADERLTAEVDPQIRAWRLPTLSWKAGETQNALVSGARAKVVAWSAEASGGPRFNLTLAAAGQEVVDEGARARPQDVLLYLDIASLPERGLGNRHVLEGQVVAPPGAVLAPVVAPTNETVGVQVDHAGRRAFLLWGGQAVVDGHEQPVLATLGAPVPREGNATWDLKLHFPTMDRRARLVMVSAIEYEVEAERTPGPPLALVLLAGLALAVARGRRSRR